MSILDQSLIFFQPTDMLLSFEAEEQTFLSPNVIGDNFEAKKVVIPGSGLTVNTSDSDPRDLVCNVVVQEISTAISEDNKHSLKVSIVGNFDKDAVVQTWMPYISVYPLTPEISITRAMFPGNAWSMSLPALCTRWQTTYDATSKALSHTVEARDRFWGCTVTGSGFTPGSPFQCRLLIYVSLEKALPSIPRL